MAYLMSKDLNKQIQSENLSQIIGGDTSVLTAAELTAIAEAQSYLVQKYDLSQEFKDLTVWDNAIAYGASDRIFLNATQYNPASTYAIGNQALQAGSVYRCKTAITVAETFNAAHWDLLGSQWDMFNAKYPYPLFDYNTQYLLNDKVYWKGKVYTCAIATQPLGQSTALQFRAIDNLPMSNVAPDNINNGLQRWGSGTAYSVPAATLPTNTTFWTPGDSRSQQLVTYIVDIALYHVHSRISPRNIPDLRVKRYDDAKAWLKMAGRGDITANIPMLQPASGQRIRYGGNIKNINSY